MKSSPEKRMKSMRPATWPQRPPAYAMPTTSQSAIGRCSAVSASVDAARGERIDVGEHGRRDERHGQPAEQCWRRAAVSRRSSRSAGAARRGSGCGRRSSALVSFNRSPKSAGHLDEHGRRHRKTEGDDGVRSRRAPAAPRDPWRHDRAASRGAPSARARTPARGRRGSPMRFTATRNASSVASPAVDQARDLLAQMVLQLRDVDGVDRLSAAEVAPPLVDLLLERYRVIWSRHRQAPMVVARLTPLDDRTGMESARQMPRSVASTACHCSRSSAS